MPVKVSKGHVNSDKYVDATDERTQIFQILKKQFPHRIFLIRIMLLSWHGRLPCLPVPAHLFLNQIIKYSIPGRRLRHIRLYHFQFRICQNIGSIANRQMLRIMIFHAHHQTMFDCIAITLYKSSHQMVGHFRSLIALKYCTSTSSSLRRCFI